MWTPILQTVLGKVHEKVTLSYEIETDRLSLLLRTYSQGKSECHDQDGNIYNGTTGVVVDVNVSCEKHICQSAGEEWVVKPNFSNTCSIKHTQIFHTFSILAVAMVLQNASALKVEWYPKRDQKVSLNMVKKDQLCAIALGKRKSI